MTYEQYASLEEKDQRALLWQKGIFLRSKIKGLEKLSLFQIDSFYVLVNYDLLDERFATLHTYKDAQLITPLRSSKIARE